MRAYDAARAWLYGLQPRGIRLELDRMREACARLGHPERTFEAVHVAGTNGKGSTCALIESVARAGGRRTGLTTSPHLHRFVERVRVAGEPIAEDEVVIHLERIQHMLGESGAPQLTFFEVTTLLAFLAFQAHRVEVAIVETGLGGRLDATNVLPTALACAITHVDLDHQAYLGTTRAAIGFEKAGILKPGVPAFIAADAGHDDGSATQAIVTQAQAIGAPIAVLGTAAFAVDGGVLHAEGLQLTLPAPSAVVDRFDARPCFQHPSNVALAGAVALALARRGVVPLSAIDRGLREARWPARRELVHARGARVLLDAAHNPDGVDTLVRSLPALRQALSADRITVVFGAMADKDWRPMVDRLGALGPLCYVRPELPRAEQLSTFVAHHPGRVFESIAAGVDAAIDAAGPAGLVVVCGSIFVVGDARAYLLACTHEAPIPM